MDKIQKEEKQKRTTGNSILKEKLVIAFTSVIEAMFLLMELYFMIHAQGNMIPLLVIAICMILVLFFLVMEILDLNQKIKDMERKEYEDIYKAQKASYLSTKRAFDEIGQRLSVLEENTTIPADDIITAQKAVAKVTISRNKENAEALMNANDELIQRVFGFEEKLADNKEELVRLQQEMMQQTREELDESQRNIQTQFDVIQNLLQQVQENIVSMDKMVPLSNTENEIPQEMFSTVEEEEPEEIAAMFASAEEAEEEEKEEEAEEEVAPMPDLTDSNKTLSPEEIAALFANV